ncbi:hypothetical protein HY492_03765 [Candidatus Woesearchaeota archaeon]|nr:hypothetical protein [Candidatus Woesearchaeota archaeon]
MTARALTLNATLFITLCAAIASALMFVMSKLPPATSFIASVSTLALGMNLCTRITKRIGAATLFFLLSALLTFGLSDTGATGWQKLVSYLLAGIVFELAFLLLNLNIGSVWLAMALGTGIAIASIPLSTAFLLSRTLATSFPLELLNLIAIAGTVGIVASALSAIAWHWCALTKPVLRLEARLLSLTDR